MHLLMVCDTPKMTDPSGYPSTSFSEDLSFGVPCNCSKNSSMNYTVKITSIVAFVHAPEEFHCTYSHIRPPQPYGRAKPHKTCLIHLLRVCDTPEVTGTSDYPSNSLLLRSLSWGSVELFDEKQFHELCKKLHTSLGQTHS